LEKSKSFAAKGGAAATNRPEHPSFHIEPAVEENKLHLNRIEPGQSNYFRLSVQSGPMVSICRSTRLCPNQAIRA
jgi:hypothetical protein